MNKKAPKDKRPSYIPLQIIKFHWGLINFKEKLSLIWPWIILCFTLLITGYNYNSVSFFQININLLGSIVSVLGAFIGIIKFRKKYLKDAFLRAEKSKDLQKISDKIYPSIIEENSEYVNYDFKVRGGNDDGILISRKVNAYLRENANNIQLVQNKKRYKKLINELKSNPQFYKNALLDCHFESRKNKKMFFNEAKISLVTTPELDSTHFEVFESNYFMSYLTNELSTLNIMNYKDKAKPKTIWRGINNYPFNIKSKRIESLENSLKSNHMGGNTIAFTQQGKMIFWQQGDSAQRSAGLLAPTGSGSLDYADYEYAKKKNSSLKTMVIHGMERELLEESHEHGDKIVDFVEETRILGFYRWVGKAGLPGFLGISKLKLGSIVNPNASETENPDLVVTEYDVNDKASLIYAIEDLIGARKNEISVPLYANLLTLKQTLEEDEEYISFIYPK